MNRIYGIAQILFAMIFYIGPFVIALGALMIALYPQTSQAWLEQLRRPF